MPLPHFPLGGVRLVKGSLRRIRQEFCSTGSSEQKSQGASCWRNACAMAIRFVHRVGTGGRSASSGMTTGTRPSSALCGRRKLKYATNSVTKKDTEPSSAPNP
ncbi:hypothetical protein GK0392 [Geobacillus kaustophilus HTA426]|uniref:Uncharacterized protein n=1 Tax=Geobacillus kaustophilus (strain HTA426) TaxID=235909 RepID=Q5L303_GEOKA|nr:hypothetical protein GK0392 [Geobacillus kaustophilus HTA426]